MVLRNNRDFPAYSHIAYELVVRENTRTSYHLKKKSSILKKENKAAELGERPPTAAPALPRLCTRRGRQRKLELGG